MADSLPAATQAEQKNTFNRCIELHDSEIAAIDYRDGTITLVFFHAYVHQSDGIAGEDAGTGWSQRAELRIEGSAEPAPSGPFPYVIYNGALMLDGVEQQNILAIPFSFTGSVVIRLLVRDDNDAFHSLILSGDKARLTLLGEPVYIETFPGSSASIAAQT